MSKVVCIGLIIIVDAQLWSFLSIIFKIGQLINVNGSYFVDVI